MKEFRVSGFKVEDLCDELPPSPGVIKLQDEENQKPYIKPNRKTLTSTHGPSGRASSTTEYHGLANREGSGAHGRGPGVGSNEN